MLTSAALEALLKEADRLFELSVDNDALPDEKNYEHCAPYYIAHHVVKPLASALRQLLSDQSATDTKRQAIVAQALSALESDATYEMREAAFDALRDEFYPWRLGNGELLTATTQVTTKEPTKEYPAGSATDKEPIMPIPLNLKQRKAIVDWAADDRLWTTGDTVAINLATFARVILAASGHALQSATDKEPICVCGHPEGYHWPMGTSENMIILPRCRHCKCERFKEADKEPMRADWQKCPQCNQRTTMSQLIQESMCNACTGDQFRDVSPAKPAESLLSATVLVAYRQSKAGSGKS